MAGTVTTEPVRSKRSSRSIALLRSKRLNPKDWDKGMTFREFVKRRNEQQRVKRRTKRYASKMFWLDSACSMKYVIPGVSHGEIQGCNFFG